MIVPRNRLLVWTGAVAVPAATLAALSPDAFSLSFFVLAGFGFAVLADALLALYRTAAVSVSAPSVVRMTRFVTAAVPLTLQIDAPANRTVRVGLALPPQIDSPHRELTVRFTPPDNRLRIDWPCTPLRRGRYAPSALFYEVPSRLGFFGMRRRAVPHLELRVYPDLRTEYRRLAAYFLGRESVGVHARRQMGKGREFEKLREYIHGDGFEDIHWKATAKRNRPITKVYQIERTQQVYVVIDISRLSGRESPFLRRLHGIAVTEEESPIQRQQSLLERYISAALMLGSAAQRQGDLYGLITFSDRLERYIRAFRGPSHYSCFRDALHTVQSREVSPDYGGVMTHIRLKLRRRALVVILTHLDDPVTAEEFVAAIDLVRRQHLVVAGVIRPEGAMPLFSREASSLDDIYAHLGRHLVWHNLARAEHRLRTKGVSMVRLDDEHLCSQLISDYLRIKQRQLL